MSRRRNRTGGTRWKRARRLVLDRDGWRCAKCGRAGRLEIDHVRSIADGGAEYELTNLQPLCISCHWAKTSAEMGYRQPGPEAVAWARYLADMV